MSQIPPISSPPRPSLMTGYMLPAVIGAVAGLIIWHIDSPFLSASLCALLVIFLSACLARYRLLRRHVSGWEQNLKTSEETFRKALDSASHGMAIVSREGRWLHVNHALSRLVGYSEEELLKLDFQTITYPDDLDADLHYVQQVLDRKIETYSMEKRYIRKDGSIVWILLSVSAVWDAVGHFRYFIAEIEDINERKLLQERLRASEARLRNQE